MPGESSSCFALSRSQSNIWSLEQRYAGTSMNCISTTVRISGRLDFSALSRALNFILESDPSLRTRLTMQDGTPMQFHAPYSEEHFSVFDFSLTDREGFTHWEETMTREPMPLLGVPLYRFFFYRTGESEGGVFLKTHHIISDGWTQILLCNRIAKTYLDLLEGRPAELELSPSYQAHVEQEQEYLSSKTFEKDERYWRQLMAGGAECACFKEQKGADLSPVGRRRSYQLPEVLNHAVYSFCQEHRVSPFAPYYMALALTLRRMGCGARFAIGVPIHNRADLTARKTSGMFVSTLPLITELDENWTAEEFSDQLSLTWFDLLRHQRFPFENIEALPRPESGRIFQIALSYQDSLSYRSESAAVHFSGRWHYSGYQAEQLCIHMTNLEDHRRYTVDYDYLAQLFSDDEMDRLHQTVCALLYQLLSCPGRPLCEATVLDAGERERVLYTFNRTSSPVQETGLWEKFSAAAQLHPARAALIEGERKVTYGALCARAKAAAPGLAKLLGSGESLTAVLLPRGIELAEVMVSLMACGGAWLLLSPDLPNGRVKDILSRSGANLLVTSRGAAERFGADGPGVPVLTTEDFPDAPGFLPPENDPERLAYVVYTSGSTGAPKGVEITRRNLLNFAHGMEKVFPRGAMLSLSNVGFDAFLLESAVSLLNGLTVVFASDEEQEDPAVLAALLSGTGVDYLCMTPSRLGAYLEHPAFREALRDRKGILCGGEAFSGELLAQLKHLTAANLYNQYGPSETTVGVSLALLDSCCLITAGRPMDNCLLYVLDDRRRPLPIGVYGELYIGGESVGRGYRNSPDLTERAFFTDPFVSGGRMYRSGDVACWTAEGRLMLRGRRDRQLKLRGQRVEPDELKFCLERHPAVKTAAVKAAEQNGQTVLLGYCVLSGETAEPDLMRYLSENLPVYLLPARILFLDALPMTASGKVDEKALPVPELGKGDLAPATRLQEEILAVFRQVLARPEMGADGDYFLFGGNSLNAMESVGLLEPIVGRRLRVSDLYACRTVQALEKFLGGTGESPAPELPAAPPLQKAPPRETYPLSEMQQSIYVQCQMAPDGMAYHMPGAFRLEKAPDRERLERAFRGLIAADDLYRTAFLFENGALCQRILPSVPFSLPVLSGGSLAEVWTAFLRPFDFTAPPLLRAALWQDGAGAWVLLLDVHHIVGDGVSTPMLLGRLDALYRGEALSPLALTYKDYCWQEASRDKNASLAPWEEHLKNLPEALDLPCDYPRPHPFDFKGDTVEFRLSDETAQMCRDACRRTGLTSYMLFAAAFGLLLSRVSRRAELTVGTPVSGRAQPELWHICGPFLSTLPLRLRPSGEETAERYLSSVRDEVLWLLDHQELPLDQVLTALDLPRSLGENPLYQVLFSYRPLDADGFTLDGGRLELLPTPHDSAKLELSLEAAESGDGFSFTFEYAVSLFARSTVEFYARCMEELLRSLVSAPGALLRDLSVLSPDDRLRLLDIPRETFVPFRDAAVDQLFSEQVRRTPAAPAVVFHDETWSCRRLEDEALRLAGLLQNAGVKPGGRVGLCCRRGPGLFAAMLAILKNGCAYVPFLPEFPAQRVGYMLETASVSAVLCDGAGAQAVPEGLSAPVVRMDGDEPSSFAPPAGRSGRDLMYILFTSGSTGKPKGVMVSCRAASNFCAAMLPTMRMDGGNVLCLTNMTFDIFLVEGLLPLSMGRTVVLCDEEERALPWRMAQRIRSGNTTTVQITPSLLRMCLTNEEFCAALSSVRLLLLAGEASSEALVDAASAVTDAALIDVYGPTEATVYVSVSRLRPGSPVTVGAPLQNCRMYVLDDDRRPVLPSARGELYLAGVCLAEGYVGRDDLTEAAFVPDPFFPGEKMYRTGDLARLRPDGEMICLGRLDAQIKLNGLRIELDEINGAAAAGGLVAQCVTVPVPAPDGSTALRLFAVPAEGKSPTSDELRGQMAALLPPYMLPAQFVFLPSIPRNPSGKADLPLLKAWKMEEDRQPAPAVSTAPCAAPAAAPAPVSAPAPAERSVPAPSPADVSPAASPAPAAPSGTAPAGDPLADAWRQILGREELLEDEPFFRQGGTSLGALGVLTKYYSAGFAMTLADFYAHPTLREQRSLLGLPAAAAAVPSPAPAPVSPDSPAPASPVSPAPAVSPAPVQVSAPASPPVRPDAPRPAAPCRPAPSDAPGRPSLPARCVLLTGATGFLGAHLLYELLEHGKVKKVLCLLRDGDRARLMDILSGYFGREWRTRNGWRIGAVRGDVTLPGFGLATRDYRALCQSVSAVYHAAADVRHYASDTRSQSVNVTGTVNVCQFALGAGVPLNHVSTLSVCAEYLLCDPERQVLFTERDFDIGQNWHDNIYVESKFLAEQAIYDRISSGLCARVFRVGRLVGRDRDGVFQHNPGSNALCLTLRGAAAAGAVPESLAGAPVDLTPVDYCAGAIVALSSGSMPVCHIADPAPVSLLEAARAVEPTVEVLSDGDFSSRLQSLLSEGRGGELAPLLEVWTRARSGSARISPDCSRTLEALRALDFPMPASDAALRLKQFSSHPEGGGAR